MGKQSNTFCNIYLKVDEGSLPKLDYQKLAVSVPLPLKTVEKSAIYWQEASIKWYDWDSENTGSYPFYFAFHGIDKVVDRYFFNCYLQFDSTSHDLQFNIHLLSNILEHLWEAQIPAAIDNYDLGQHLPLLGGNDLTKVFWKEDHDWFFIKDILYDIYAPLYLDIDYKIFSPLHIPKQPDLPEIQLDHTRKIFEIKGNYLGNENYVRIFNLVIFDWLKDYKVHCIHPINLVFDIGHLSHPRYSRYPNS